MTREAHRITKLLNLSCASSIYVAALTQCNGSFDRHSHKLSATDPSEPKHNICIERRRRRQRRKTIMFLPQVIFATAVIITGKPVCVSLLFALLDLMRRWDVWCALLLLCIWMLHKRVFIYSHALHSYFRFFSPGKQYLILTKARSSRPRLGKVDLASATFSSSVMLPR